MDYKYNYFIIRVNSKLKISMMQKKSNMIHHLNSSTITSYMIILFGNNQKITFHYLIKNKIDFKI